VGFFFMLLGAGLIMLFIYSDIARAPQAGLLVLGTLAFLLGMVLRWSNPAPPPQSSGRFGMLKKREKQDHVKESTPKGPPTPR
jgi:hypothetical protein